MLMLDDNAPDHAKIEALSDRAFRGWIRALAWSSRTGQDGVIPEQMPKRWDLAAKHVAELEGGGLWDRNGAGWVIHDYNDYNPPNDGDARKRWYAARRQQRKRDSKRDGSVTDA